MILKRIDPLSAAKIAGVLYALIGLVGGFFWGLIMMMMSVFKATPQTNAFGVFSGVFIFLIALILFPLLYGAFGFVFTLIAAWLYNVLARKVGGIRFEFEAAVPVYVPPPYLPPPPARPPEGF